MKKRVWNATRKLLSFALLFALTIVFANPMTIQAKAKTLKLPWANITEGGEAYIESKAVTVKKTGTYNIVQKKSQSIFDGYVKFVAPKTKTYTFSFGNVRDEKKSHVLAWVQFMAPTGVEDGIENLEPKSKGYPKGGQMPFAYKVPGKLNVKTRTATLRMKKGDIAYINIVCTYIHTKGKTLKSTMKIK